MRRNKLAMKWGQLLMISNMNFKFVKLLVIFYTEFYSAFDLKKAISKFDLEKLPLVINEHQHEFHHLLRSV